MDYRGAAAAEQEMQRQSEEAIAPFAPELRRVAEHVQEIRLYVEAMSKSPTPKATDVPFDAIRELQQSGLFVGGDPNSPFVSYANTYLSDVAMDNISAITLVLSSPLDRFTSRPDDLCTLLGSLCDSWDQLTRDFPSSVLR